MYLKRLIPILAFGMLMSGCGMASNQSTGTEAAGVIPSNYAGPPVTINIPQRFPNWPQITVTKSGDKLKIHSGSTQQIQWRGRLVTLYYVPERNVENRGGRSVLTSTVGLQKIGSAPITAHGAWQHVWTAPHKVLQQRHVFILVQTNEGQVGLASL